MNFECHLSLTIYLVKIKNYKVIIIGDGEKKEEPKGKVLDASKPITLDFLTNPDKEWIQKIKMNVWA